MNAGATRHEVTRLTLDIGQPFAEFCARYEAAVPAFAPERIAAIVRAGGGWSEIIADTTASAPHGFLLYWKGDTSRLMRIAGAGPGSGAVSYLMGNHTIAAHMFRFEPSALLYAPLRTLILEAPDERTRFVVDQPSSHFSSFADATVAETGRELDRKLAALLEVLDVRAPAELTRY